MEPEPAPSKTEASMQTARDQGWGMSIGADRARRLPRFRPPLRHLRRDRAHRHRPRPGAPRRRGPQRGNRPAWPVRMRRPVRGGVLRRDPGRRRHPGVQAGCRHRRYRLAPGAAWQRFWSRPRSAAWSPAPAVSWPGSTRTRSIPPRCACWPAFASGRRRRWARRSRRSRSRAAKAAVSPPVATR